MSERDERKLDMTMGDLRELLEQLPLTPLEIGDALHAAWHEFNPAKNAHLNTIWSQGSTP